MERHSHARSVQLTAADVLVLRKIRRRPRIVRRVGRQRAHSNIRESEKIHPADKLWPINDTWFFHSGANPGNDILINIQQAVDARYGPSSGAEEFSRKAQLAHYEATRAQFEAFAADGWANHKMTIYWMLNGHWPSFFGNIFDYYLEPGGAYFGAKAGCGHCR